MNKKIKKYKKELDYIKDLFVNQIKTVNVCGIYIYGSSANEDLFDESFSDIDIIVFCSNYEDVNKSIVIKELESFGFNFLEKKPTRTIDSLCDRIELYIGDFAINFDITITSKLIPDYNTLVSEAWYDSFEALMGGVYLKHINLYKNPSDYNLFNEKFLPFYNDELRFKRLDIISNRLNSYLKRINYYKVKNVNAYIDHTLKMRKYFIKFLFIYYRKYYYTPEKNIYYQLKNILNIDDSIVNFLSLSDDKSTKEQCDLINDYAYNMINRYFKERENK